MILDTNLDKEVSFAKMDIKKHNLKSNYIFPVSIKESQISHELKQMSMKRKFFFVFFLFICFFTVGIFLILPCEWSNCNCNLIANGKGELWRKVIFNMGKSYSNVAELKNNFIMQNISY